MFAIELLLPELSARTFLPVALATGTATFIGRIFFGIHPAFAIPAKPLYVGAAGARSLHCCCLPCWAGSIGLAATAFIRGLSWRRIYSSTSKARIFAMPSAC